MSDARMSQDETAGQNVASRGRRERSTRYPGVPLAESVELCRFVESRGLDGLSASEIASALGYKNIKTNTFSARLSAARQFGLLELRDEGYWLTDLARSILHPVAPSEMPTLYRRALLSPPLYADLSERLAGKKVPDAAILGNILYHHHHIIASAKQAAAEAFLTSARFAGALGADQIFSPNGIPEAAPTSGMAPGGPSSPVVTDPQPFVPDVPASSPAKAHAHASVTGGVRIDLRLWGPDQGKVIRVRAPESITQASLDRLLEAIRLHVRIQEDCANTE